MLPSLITSSKNQRTGGGQAHGLRALVAERAASLTSQSTARRDCHTIVVSGGKGGVGRSVIAVNLAIALAQRGGNVGLIDASPHLSSISFLCDLGGYWNLLHVMQGCRQLHEVMCDGPGKIQILSGANCLTNPSATTSPLMEQTFDQLMEWEQQLDWLVIDASGTTTASTCEFIKAADDLLIVTTPEATAITEAYATVKSLAATTRPRLGLLVNQAATATQAQQILDRLQQTTHSLLQRDLHRRGYIVRDDAVSASVNARCPFILKNPTSTAALSLYALAQRWTRPRASDAITSYFSRVRSCNHVDSRRN